MGHAQRVSHGKMANMRYALLTCNPGPEDDSNTRLNNGSMRWCSPSRKVVHRTGNRWSIGTNWKIIEAGDMVCMFGQGVHGRDIVATGVITRGAFRDSHWNPDKTVQARLGHASAAETLDTYSHLWPDSDDRTREAVDVVLGRPDRDTSPAAHRS